MLKYLTAPDMIGLYYADRLLGIFFKSVRLSWLRGKIITWDWEGQMREKEGKVVCLQRK